MTKAFIVLGGPTHQLPSFLKEEGVFVGVDRGALALLQAGISPDLAIGDFDSITDEERETVKTKAKKFVGFASEKDDTDTELALMETINEFSPTEMTVFNWEGGRMDHLMSILYLVLQPRFYDYIPKIRLKNQKNSISYYLPGSYTIKKEPDKHYLSYIGMTPIQSLSLKNVKYPLDQEDFNYPMALVSNEFEEKEARFSFEEGILAVIQSTD